MHSSWISVLTREALSVPKRFAELQVRMPKPAQAEVRSQVRGTHVMECHGCQVIAVAR